MGFLNKVIREVKRGIDHITGKHQVKKQYHQGVEKSYALETEMQAALYVQLCTEQAKIAEQRHATQIFTQQETERFLKEKTELPKLQAEKEAAFKIGCDEIRHEMLFIRAALYACMEGNIEMVKSFLVSNYSNQYRRIFLNLYPLHIAAEHNRIEIIKLLGAHAVNFNRTNAEGDLAIELAVIQGNVEAVTALTVLEQKTEALWVVMDGESDEREIHRIGLMPAVTEGADLNVTDEQGNTLLGLAISRQRSLTFIAQLMWFRVELNPSWSVDQKRTLINTHPDAETRAFLLEHFVETEQGIMTVKNDEPLLSEGPKWSDTNGWHAPHYHLTIHSVMVEVNGKKQLYVLGRGSAGILLHSYDFITSSWITHPMGPPWSDQNGCTAAPYYSTIRVAVARVEGANQLFVLMRYSGGIDLWRYDPVGLKWTQQPPGTTWSDLNGCAAEPYYSTIRLTVAQVEEADQLFVLMRYSGGIDLWRYDPIALKWTQQSPGTPWSDQNGCAAPSHYSTLRLVTTRALSQGRDQSYKIRDQLLVLMRYANGIDVWRYDPEMLTWTQHVPLNIKWFGPDGFGTIPFSTFRVIVGGGHGTDEMLYLFIRQADKIHLLRYQPSAICPSTSLWQTVYLGPAGRGPYGGAAWTPACYEDTIQFKAVRDCSGGADNLVLFAPSSAGIEAHIYNPGHNLWVTLPNPIPFTDPSIWSAASTYYQNIQIHHALIHDQNKILILARSGNGIKCESLVWNVHLLRENFLKWHLSETHVYIQKATAFLAEVDGACKSLLSTAEQGNWLGIKECLTQGAYINATNEQGYNAVQVAIIAQKLSLEMLNGLIGAGIDLEHQTSKTENTIALANQYMPELIPFLSPEPVMGIRKSLSTPMTTEALKTSFQEHCERAQRFLDKYPEDNQKIQAMLAYYAWLSKTEPYALYVLPAMVMLSQLTAVLKKAEESLPDEWMKDLPQKQVLEAAQLFFKRTRAMHCILNEVGTEAHTLATDPLFMDFEWSYVASSIQLKREAITVAKNLETNIYDQKVSETVCKTQSALILAGTTSVLGAFIAQVFGLDMVKPTELEKMAADFLKTQEEHDDVLKATIKQQMRKDMTEVVREASDSGLIQLPAKRGLKQALQEWEVVHQDCQLKIETAETELKLEKEALNAWLNQKEAEYLSLIEKCKQHIQSTHLADAALLAQYNMACTELSAQFNQQRAELNANFKEAKHKIDKNFARSSLAIVAALIIAPQLAPTLTGILGVSLGVASSVSTMATLELIVKGALIGGMSAKFSGNTGGILKGAFMSGWTAGFGSVLGGVLGECSAIHNLDKLFASNMHVGQRVISTALVKAAQTLPTALESGKLSANLLNSIGTTLVLGTSQELSFVEKLNEHFVSVLVSATVTSLVTRTNFIGNAAILGVSTLLQATASYVGHQLAHARTVQASQSISTASLAPAVPGRRQPPPPPPPPSKPTEVASIPAESSVAGEQGKVSVQVTPGRRRPPPPPPSPEATEIPKSHEHASGQGYHVPENALKAMGVQACDKFLGTSQVPVTLMDRRDALLEKIHGPYHIPESRAATILAGGVVETVTSAVGAVVSVIQCSAAAENAFLRTPELQAIRAEQVGKLLDFAKHPIDNVVHGLEADLKMAEESYRVGKYFQTGEHLAGPTMVAAGIASVITPPASLVLSAGAKATERVTGVVAKKLGHLDFQSPITFHFDSCKLYSGFPVDAVKLQKPWKQKSMGSLAKENCALFSFNEIKSFSTKAALDGELYPKNKLLMLVNYLEKRGTYVYGTDRAPHFKGKRNAPSQIYLPENPTVLQVKHELSHWLDFKRLGFEKYSTLSVYQREKMVLERLQTNRVWKDLNQFEKDFSLNYVEEIRNGYIPGIKYE